MEGKSFPVESTFKRNVATKRFLGSKTRGNIDMKLIRIWIFQNIRITKLITVLRARGRKERNDLLRWKKEVN